MTKLLRSVRGELAGKAHAGIYPSAKKAAAFFGHDLSTEHRWRLSGAPHLTRYLEQAPNKWRALARMRVHELAKQEIRRLTQPQVLERFRELSREFSETLVQTMDQSADEVDRAAADERLSALAAERAALRERLADAHLTEADVWRTR